MRQVRPTVMTNNLPSLKYQLHIFGIIILQLQEMLALSRQLEHIYHQFEQER